MYVLWITPKVPIAQHKRIWILLLLLILTNFLQPIVEVFSLLAIATSYIGFVLGLSDFLADCKYLHAFVYSTVIVW